MNARILAITNHKGGVGKTTTAASLGAALAAKGRKVLLVDMDAQANLTCSFVYDNQTGGKTLYEAMRGDIALPLLRVSGDLYGSIDLVPSTIDMAGLDLEIASSIGREYILHGLLEPVRGQYDYILLDCPPSLGLMTVNSLVAADLVLVPVVAENYAYQGISKIWSVVETIRKRLNKGLSPGGILITRWEGKKLNRTVEDLLRTQYGNMVFNTKIRINVSLAEAGAMRKTIFEYAPTSNGAKDYAAFCDELLERIGDKEG